MAKSKTNILEYDESLVDEMPTRDTIIDIDLSATKKQKFRIDGDNDKIIEINTSDIGILKRLAEGEKRLSQIMTKVTNLISEKELDPETVETMPSVAEDIATDSVIAAIDAMDEADKEMREVLDYIFDADVSSVCDYDGKMYDPIGGKIRYMYIIDRLLTVYGDTISREAKALSKQARQRTDKYTKK